MSLRDTENPGLGGAEIVMAELAKALASDGHSVNLLCAKFPGAASEAWVDGVHIMRISPESVLGVAAQLEYRRKFKGKVDLVLEDIGGTPFFAPLYVREPVISIWFQDFAPIFEQQYPRPLLPILLALERLIVLSHNRSWVMVLSHASKEGLIRKGGNPGRIKVLFPGLAQRFLQLEAPLAANLREPRIVCLGKIRRYKCQHHSILTLRRILSKLPDVRLSIVGRRADEAYLEEMVRTAEELGISRRVDFELNASEDRKVDLLRRSRVLLAPAPVEGFGIAILEASACGLPTVGTLGVPDEALREGVNGFRVPFGDIAAMSRKVELLFQEDKLFDELAQTAYNFAKQFRWETAAKSLRETILQLESRNRVRDA